MSFSPTIRSFVAFLLLLVALFGSTPKKYVHDALAVHSDVSYGFKGEGTAVRATTFQCGFDHQVAESPFTGTEIIQVPQPFLTHHNIRGQFFYTDPATGYKAMLQGRGPPQV